MKTFGLTDWGSVQYECQLMSARNSRRRARVLSVSKGFSNVNSLNIVYID